MDCVTVDFSLREAGRVSIALIAADGHSGEITDAGPHSAGTQRCTIPLPADLASGPYIARISTPLNVAHHHCGGRPGGAMMWVGTSTGAACSFHFLQAGRWLWRTIGATG
ncbi:MAG: hypothetical protein IPG69_05985 [Flavobacteriales bacterium]|nr:hypothetical protein [Flavobacteriales bacterium]